ncbi:protein krueppel-like [Rhagoletis pomonella]|uniref:protein krueppel-like n=1 Tax=Rhagoletis pomonella TaxID=28610 RepID=UPI00177AE546|nr:protein krueppel-like [Rhagoletis pomonella]
MDTGSQLRRNLRVKTSPPSSPVCTPVIKYEPAPSIDDNEDELSGVASLGIGSQSGTISVGITGDSTAILPVEGADDEQPCDLRLSSFRMNLVSMALQQAAAAVISGGSVTSPSGIQQAALQTMAAAPPTHLPSLINFPHPHTPHTHAQLPSQASAQPRSITPTRRYSTSTSTATSGGPAAGVGPEVVPSNRVASPLGGAISVGPLTAASNSSATSGPSTSAAAAAASSALLTGANSSDEVAAGRGGAISNSGSSHIAVIAPGSGGSFGGAYTCERCGNSYARPHSLNRHMRFECGVEPKFECPICHKKSKHKHNLVLHMRTHQHR